MSLTIEDVTKVAKLARIPLTDKEKEEALSQLGGIFKWIDQLQQVNTDGVEIFSDQQPFDMPEREDVVCDGNVLNEVLANAPESAHGMFAVPKVVE